MFGVMKIYLALIFVLVGAQIVVASETVYDFQRELERYHKEREPSQTEGKNHKTEFKNPEIEIKVEKEMEKKKD